MFRLGAWEYSWGCFTGNFYFIVCDKMVILMKEVIGGYINLNWITSYFSYVYCVWQNERRIGLGSLRVVNLSPKSVSVSISIKLLQLVVRCYTSSSYAYSNLCLLKILFTTAAVLYSLSDVEHIGPMEVLLLLCNTIENERHIRSLYL